jgi:hypothetical protein
LSNRWGFLTGIDIGTVEGDPYLDRLRLIETPFFSVFLHHIHRPDHEADPHDHPWFFTSIVLCGAYTEMVWPDKYNRRRMVVRNRCRFSVNGMPLEAAHIITKIKHPLWTLVVTGPDRGEWGFYPEGSGGVDWRTHLGLRYVERHEAARKAGRSG